MPRLVELFENADENSSWVRVPVVNYLRASPLPEAKLTIEKLKKIDAEAVKRAMTFFPLGSDKKTPEEAGASAEHRHEVAQGLTRSEFRECLVQAGQQRMLPIFLTTATTIGGLIPLALSGGPLWTGLAWCMIVGLAIATVLTLYVVPAVYAILVETFRVKPIPVEEAAT